MMQKILISACLLGDRVRYDGGDSLINDVLIQQWQGEGRLVKLCPEMVGGLSTPRDAAEIQAMAESLDGSAVLAGNARVKTQQGDDVTAAFVAGAKAALSLAKQQSIQLALLKANSPSCGNQQIYTGHFDGSKQRGQGVTAALLQAHGVQVFNENELAALQVALEILLQ